MESTDSPPKQNKNPFFQLIDDSEWNACIGPQGAEENYVDGYIDASIELASAVIDKDMKDKRDTLVLPALYNARHAVELSLKFALRLLHQVGASPNPPAKTHDIKGLWEALNICANCDEILRKYAKDLEPYVVSLGQIDDDGQQLRYHENREGEQSLAGRPLANLLVIRNSLASMREVTSALKDRVLDLASERVTGSHTARCSRRDLIELAKMLPPANQWNDPVMDEAKARAKARFALGGKELAAAIEIIKNNRAMRMIIGLETDLHYLSDQDAAFAVQQWYRRHPPRAASEEPRIVQFGTRDLKDIIAGRQLEKEINDAIIATLRPDAIADLETVYYIGRQRAFCEHYERKLADTMAEHRAAQDLGRVVDHLMDKTNFLTCLARGLEILGRPKLAGELLAMKP